MYGVDWMTPPHIPATSVASPSIAITPRVSYSSPAAAALSVGAAARSVRAGRVGKPTQLAARRVGGASQGAHLAARHKPLRGGAARRADAARTGGSGHAGQRAGLAGRGRAASQAHSAVTLGQQPPRDPRLGLPAAVAAAARALR